MISAKLMEELRKEGFELNFPSYDSTEQKIITILKEQNERLNLAIPLLLRTEFDYEQIIKKLSLTEKRKFNRILLITRKIFKLENMPDTHITKIIKKNNLKYKIPKNEFQYYYDTFKTSLNNLEKEKEKKLKKQIKLRKKLNTNKALSEIFSPAKIRIMRNIFAHEQLTNTELKYYYRSIRPLILSILNENMQNYLKVIESTRKYKS